MSNYSDMQGRIAHDNKRKVMQSRIFDNDDSNSYVPVTYQPKYTNPERNNDNYNYQDDAKNNNQYTSSVVSSNYQNNAPSSYQKPKPIAPVEMADMNIHISPIEQIENPQPLPTLTPFPEFRFDAIAPIEQVDLGIHPRSIPSSIANENEKSNLNKVVFEIGGALQKIRDDLMQETINISQKMKSISENNDNFQLNADLFRFPKNTENEESQQNNDYPQFTATSQFVLPDGTMIPDS